MHKLINGGYIYESFMIAPKITSGWYDERFQQMRYDKTVQGNYCRIFLFYSNDSNGG